MLGIFYHHNNYLNKSACSCDAHDLSCYPGVEVPEGEQALPLCSLPPPFRLSPEPRAREGHQALRSHSTSGPIYEWPREAWRNVLWTKTPSPLPQW